MLTQCSIFLFMFLTSILIASCLRKPRPKLKKTTEKVKKTTDPCSDPAYDETQVPTVELQDDPLANVRLLTPTLPGGCNDGNAGKEAADRHKTNNWFPKLEVQKKRIVNSTTEAELKRMVDELPPHPPQMFRKELKEPNLEERKAKWKNVHVNWHETGLVYLVRSQDACRSKEEAGPDTVDSPSKETEKAEESKMNSEIPLSGGGNRSKPSKKSAIERKLAATQEESLAVTQEVSLKTPKIAGKSV